MITKLLQYIDPFAFFYLENVAKISENKDLSYFLHTKANRRKRIANNARNYNRVAHQKYSRDEMLQIMYGIILPLCTPKVIARNVLRIIQGILVPFFLLHQKSI